MEIKTAKEEKAFRRLSRGLMEAEERSQMIRSLLAKEVGFREEEEFIRREESKLKGGGDYSKMRMEILSLAMGKKLKDNARTPVLRIL